MVGTILLAIPAYPAQILVRVAGRALSDTLSALIY